MNLDPEKFQVTECNDLRLIIPARAGAVGNGPWTKQTIKYRSRVETLDGNVVSQGYKKFFNLGTGPHELQITIDDVIKACERKDAIATLKVDGSLLIRSVYKNEVMLRTRGSFGYEFLDNAHEMEHFKKVYPKLFDHSWYPQTSILLEWTSPENVIVIKYDRPELTLLGAINHQDLSYMPIDLLRFVSEDLDIPLVDNFKLTKDGWESLQEAMETDDSIEGFVIRINNEQDLVKVKCKPYLTKHGLKSSLTTEKLADIYFQQGRPDFKTFCETFIDNFDEETFLWALGAISSLYDGVKELNAIMHHMQLKVDSRASMTRKEAAIAGLAEYGQTKRFAAYMELWQGKSVKTEILKSILLQSSNHVEISMFEPTQVME